MADQEEPPSLASTFPNPPSFWKDFTPERIARIDELRRTFSNQHHADDDDASHGDEQGDLLSVRLPGLPEGLVNLQPPPEPADGRWRVFGDQYVLDDKLPTLEEQGIQNLPQSTPSTSRTTKHYDRALELKRLSKSLLLNFLELVGTLSRHQPLTPAQNDDGRGGGGDAAAGNADAAEAKIGDLRTLFINIHHALNEYRPHQARESAIELMQEHLDRTRSETVAVRTQVDRARRVLEGLGSLRIEESGEIEKEKGERDGDEDVLERERNLWKAADALLA